jgi:hypothetical protein
MLFDAERSPSKLWKFCKPTNLGGLMPSYLKNPRTRELTIGPSTNAVTRIKTSEMNP